VHDRLVTSTPLTDLEDSDMTVLDAATVYELAPSPAESTRGHSARRTTTEEPSLWWWLGEAVRITVALVAFVLVAFAPLLAVVAIGVLSAAG
jgi:hypothetical protein